MADRTGDFLQRALVSASLHCGLTGIDVPYIYVWLAAALAVRGLSCA